MRLYCTYNIQPYIREKFFKILDRIMAQCEPLSTNGVVMDIHRSGQPAKMSPSAQWHIIMKSENIPEKLPKSCGSLHHQLMSVVMTVQNWTSWKSWVEYTASLEEQPSI